MDTAAKGQRTIKSFVDNYLSERHRDYPGKGCPITALATDIARLPSDSPLRAEYVDGLRGVLAEIENLLAGSEALRAHRAMALLAMLVGALAIARATPGDRLSDDMLAAVKSLATKLAGQS